MNALVLNVGTVVGYVPGLGARTPWRGRGCGLLVSGRSRSTKDVKKNRRMMASGKSEASGLVMMRAVNVKVLSS